MIIWQGHAPSLWFHLPSVTSFRGSILKHSYSWDGNFSAGTWARNTNSPQPTLSSGRLIYAGLHCARLSMTVLFSLCCDSWLRTKGAAQKNRVEATVCSKPSFESETPSFLKDEILLAIKVSLPQRRKHLQTIVNAREPSWRPAPTPLWKIRTRLQNQQTWK